MSRKLSLPQIIVMIAAVIAIVAFFLPFISATDEYRVYMADHAEDKAYSGLNITVGSMMDMSLFEYATTYYQGGEALFGSANMGVIYCVIITAIAVFALLALLAAWRFRPILTLLCDILMVAAFSLINWDFTSRGIMPSSDRAWGVAHYLYYPLAAVILVCAVWMLVTKRRRKNINPG